MLSFVMSATSRVTLRYIVPISMIRTNTRRIVRRLLGMIVIAVKSKPSYYALENTLIEMQDKYEHLASKFSFLKRNHSSIVKRT